LQLEVFDIDLSEGGVRELCNASSVELLLYFFPVIPRFTGTERERKRE
jgi:hypothetical protein